jgi:hypothetical protein
LASLLLCSAGQERRLRVGGGREQGTGIRRGVVRKMAVPQLRGKWELQGYQMRWEGQELIE